MLSVFEQALIGFPRTIHFVDGTRSTPTEIKDIIFDIQGQPAVLITTRSVVKWDQVSWIDTITR